MTTLHDVEREALSDWLDVRGGLAADERADPSEYAEDDPAVDCGLSLRLGGCGWCERCTEEGDELLDGEREP